MHEIFSCRCQTASINVKLKNCFFFFLFSKGKKTPLTFDKDWKSLSFIPNFSFKILIPRWTVTVKLWHSFPVGFFLVWRGGCIWLSYTRIISSSPSFCPCSVVPLPQLPGTHVRQWHCPPGSGFPADAKDQPHALYRCTVSHHHSPANST